MLKLNTPEIIANLEAIGFTTKITGYGSLNITYGETDLDELYYDAESQSHNTYNEFLSDLISEVYFSGITKGQDNCRY